MKIRFVGGTKKFTIAFPTSLFFGRIGSFVLKKATEGELKVKARDMKKIRKTIKELRKKNEKWYLLELDSNDGQTLKIEL